MSNPTYQAHDAPVLTITHVTETESGIQVYLTKESVTTLAQWGDLVRTEESPDE